MQCIFTLNLLWKITVTKLNSFTKITDLTLYNQHSLVIFLMQTYLSILTTLLVLFFDTIIILHNLKKYKFI